MSIQTTPDEREWALRTRALEVRDGRLSVRLDATTPLIFATLDGHPSEHPAVKELGALGLLVYRAPFVRQGAR